VGTSRLAGPAAGAAALVATVGLAFDGGGFGAVSWGRALVLGAAAALALLLAGGGRPSRPALATLAALALLTGWTAASWLWSASPPAALEEAQRVAAYLAAAAAVAAAGRRAPLPWLAAGVAAGIVPAACWNLALRLAPDWTGRPAVRVDVGSLADPVGYANGLALLDVVALVLLVGSSAAARRRGVRRLAALLLVPLAADVAVLESDGALVALAASLLALLLAGGRRTAWRVVTLLPLPTLALAGVASADAVVSPSPLDLRAAAAPGHRLLLGLLLLCAAQAGAALATERVPARWPSVRLRHGAAAAGLVAAAALAAAPFALRGHERSAYWHAAWRETADRPVLGGGAGTYVDWWLRTRQEPLSTREAHSLYVETLAELGPVGLLLVAAALGIPLVAAARLRRSHWGPPVLAALVAYAVHAAVDFDWELAGVTLPVILLGAGAAAASGPAEPERLRARPRAAAALAVAVLLAAGALGLAGGSALAAATDAAAAGRYEAAVARARDALRFAPWSAQAWRTIGDARLAAGDRAAARAAYREALRLDPADWQTWAELAGVSGGEPRRRALAEAARLNPLQGASG
jgi:O-Antigen ligase